MAIGFSDWSNNAWGPTPGLLSRAGRRWTPLQDMGPQLGPLTMPDTSMLQPTVAPVQQQRIPFGKQLAMGFSQVGAQPWLALGAGLLDAANHQGTIGQAFQGFSGAMDAQQQRKLAQEDQQYIRDQRAQQQAQIEARKRYIAGLSPEQRAIAEAAPEVAVEAGAQRAFARPEQVVDGGFIWTRNPDGTLSRGEEVPLNASQRAEIEARRMAANPGTGLPRGFMKPTGRDAMIYQQYEGVYASSQEAINNLKRTKAILQQMAQAGALGQPVDAAMRMRISRLTNSNPEARALYENLNSQVWPVVLENLKGLAPVTEVELSQALSRTVNADMTPGGVAAEIDRLIANAERAQATAGAGLDFASQGGSYATGRNGQGQTWREVLDAAQKPYANVAALPDVAPPAAAPQGPRDLAGLIDSALRGTQRVQPSQGWNANRIRQIPAQDRAEIYRRQGDAAARAEFDRHYGPGAADAVLAAQGVASRPR